MADYKGELIVNPVTEEEAHGLSGVKTVGAWRKLLKASGGTVPGPASTRVAFDVESCAHLGDGALLEVYVQFVDPKSVGSKDPDGKPA